MSVERLRGRGVYFLDGIVECPLAGVGARGAHASNRIVLDDEHSEVRVDRAARRIVWENRHRYPRLTLVGDLMLLGRDGAVPFVLHTRFDKSGQTLKARPHLHPAVRAPIRAPTLEPLEVVFSNGSREQVVLTPELGRRVVTSPPLASWIGRALLTVRRAPTTAAACLVVAVGVGPLARDLLRAEVLALGDGPPGKTLRALLQAPGWELRLTALSSLRSLREHLGRAMFLLGLDHIPALRRVATDGLARGETLRFRLEGGRGTVTLGADEAELPAPLDTARAFLELDFMGAILAQELAGALEQAPILL